MYNNTVTKDPTTPQVCRYTTMWNVKCLKSTNWKQDDFCNNTFKEINNQATTCLLSQLLSKVTHMLQFLHQIFNLFALLRDDPLKPATPLTNGAIDETLQQSAPLSDDCLLQLVDSRESSTLINHLLRAAQTAQSTEFKSGLFGGQMWGSMYLTFSRRRYTCRCVIMQPQTVHQHTLTEITEHAAIFGGMLTVATFLHSTRIRIVRYLDAYTWAYLWHWSCAVTPVNQIHYNTPTASDADSRSGIPGNRGPPKFPAGIPGNFWNSGGNYGEFMGVLFSFQFLLLIMTF